MLSKTEVTHRMGSHILKSVLLGAWLALLALPLVGCERDAETADRTQIQVAKGNKNLAEMKGLGDQLAQVGLYVDLRFKSKDDEVEYKSRLLKSTSAERALEIKAALETFIDLGQQTLGIADEGLVLFSDRQKIEDQIAAAKSWLEITNQFLLSHSKN